MVWQKKKSKTSRKLWRIDKIKSKQVGESISEVEVLNITNHGFWLSVHGREYFLAFNYLPWFRDAKISSILNVELPHPHHLYWPDLDVDLELDSIECPEKYPLVDTYSLTKKST